MKIAIFRDCMGWANKIKMAAISRGHDVCFTPDGADVAFARVVTFEPWRHRGLSFLRDATERGIPTLPEPANLHWYDDKVAQADILAMWLPDTIILRKGDEFRIPNSGYPFISKASTGAASRNVRLIRNEDDARAEYHAALEGDGIPILPSGVQKGYLYWQRFVPGNDGDIRVIVIGDEAFGIRRGNRDDVPFASGSGRIEIIRRIDDPQTAQAFRMADEISRVLDTRWQAYDFVFDGGICYCLEATCSWTDSGYVGCPTFDRATLEPTGTTQDDWPMRAVIEMERICLR